MRTYLLCAMFIVLALSFGCRKGSPIYNSNDTFSSVSGALSMGQVREAIFGACSELTWIPTDISENTILAKLTVRNKHIIQVSIKYSPTNFAITYHSSVNMEYKVNHEGVTVIHPNYNKWVANLESKINAKLTMMKR